MKLVGSRKFTWGICSIGILLAIVSVFFLPQIIPVHFANGIADGFGNKMEVFLFPILLFIITLLTGKEKIKYFLTHSKTFLTDVQYNLMIDGVLGIDCRDLCYLCFICLSVSKENLQFTELKN